MIIVCIVFIILLISVPIWGINEERKDFNNGVCPKCGKQLRCFDMDSQGGRGYSCDKCDYTTWVSYNRVDRNYRNKI